jgi:hypothetical protein
MHICYILHIACALHLILFRLQGYELSSDEDEPPFQPDDPADGGSALRVDDMSHKLGSPYCSNRLIRDHSTLLLGIAVRPQQPLPPPPAAVAAVAVVAKTTLAPAPTPTTTTTRTTTRATTRTPTPTVAPGDRRLQQRPRQRPQPGPGGPSEAPQRRSAGPAPPDGCPVGTPRAVMTMKDPGNQKSECCCILIEILLQDCPQEFKCADLNQVYS